MNYTEQNIIGLNLKHKNYKDEDVLGKYIVVEGGLWFISTSYIRTFANYTSEQIIANIDKGAWIPYNINNNNYYFY